MQLKLKSIVTIAIDFTIVTTISMKMQFVNALMGNELKKEVQQMNDIELLLNDLKNINYRMGRHGGLWERCDDREELVENTLKYMKSKAKKYNIFIDENEIDDGGVEIEYHLDNCAYQLYFKMNEMIINKIINSKMEEEIY